MMVLLVNERRKEIAVLKTLGMSSKRLCSCFALSGLILGALGAFIGISLAQITLTNLDLLIQYISYLQGSPLLNPIYYGKTLPNTMSPHAVKMVLMGNTTLALLGSCLAAWQTSRLNPADIFRSL
jgi:lipoprotein-releasing system permease protein